MRQRPWPIVILALVQVLMPVFSLLLNSWISGVEPGRYLVAFLEHKAWYEVIDFFLLYPIAGVAIFLMKKWSYPVFLLIMLWTIGANTQVWVDSYSGDVSWWLLVAVNAINIFFVTYFLLPAVRKFYFNKQLRWWESQPRFLVNFGAQVEQAEKAHACKVRDISQGGVFIQLDSELNQEKELTFQLQFLNLTVRCPGQIVHTQSQKGNGYGIQLKPDNESKKSLARLIKALQLLGCELRWEPEPLWQSFTTWLRQALAGYGWIPRPK